MQTSADIEAQKTAWLAEHLPYQLRVARHTYARLFGNLDNWDWNAMYIAFASAARNLRLFLTNKDKGSNNFGAQNFVKAGFSANVEPIKDRMNRLNEQIFHLDKARPTDASSKFQLEDAEIVLDWIEKGIASFLSQLEPEQRSQWNHQIAPVPAPQLFLRISDARQTACTADPVIM